MAKTNKEILNAIREEASAEYKERVPEIKGPEDMERTLRAYDQYPSAKAEFINAITAKIFKSVVMNKVWNNPLVMLKKGEIPYGQGIEQLFVELSEKKDFDEHFKNSNNSDQGDLLAKQTPDVLARFIQRNFAYKYKVSLSNQRLRNAFSSANGVANLIDGLVASVMTSANNEEFKDMLGILTRKTDENTGKDNQGLGKREKGIIQRIADAGNNDGGKGENGMFVKISGKMKDDSVHITELVEKIRTYASELSFLSNKYNLARVNTACQPEDLVLFTTSDIVAKLDVNVIAHAFNVSATDVNVRIIKVPMTTFAEITESKNWGTGQAKTKIRPIAVLADKEAIQQYDTLIESGSFYNPDKLMTNMFVHRQGITASCDYAQTIVFGTDEN